jgi:hypothetical protein
MVAGDFCHSLTESSAGSTNTSPANLCFSNQDTNLVIDNSKYCPSDQEPFMNERQRKYFCTKLLLWRDEILAEAKET